MYSILNLGMEMLIELCSKDVTHFKCGNPGVLWARQKIISPTYVRGGPWYFLFYFQLFQPGDSRLSLPNTTAPPTHQLFQLPASLYLGRFYLSLMVLRIISDSTIFCAKYLIKPYHKFMCASCRNRCWILRNICYDF